VEKAYFLLSVAGGIVGLLVMLLFEHAVAEDSVPSFRMPREQR
jgi:hypothetical protein